jgi:hypothetical protein
MCRFYAHNQRSDHVFSFLNDQTTTYTDQRPNQSDLKMDVPNRAGAHRSA